MKRIIILLSILTNLVMTPASRAQFDGAFRSQTGRIDMHKCGFQEFTNVCIPIVKFYMHENYVEHKDYSVTGGESGHFDYGANCIANPEIVGGSSLCSTDQTNVLLRRL